MNHRNTNLNNNIESSPTSSNYSKEVKNKAHEKSPYGKKEPSPNTTYK